MRSSLGYVMHFRYLKAGINPRFPYAYARALQQDVLYYSAETIES